MARTQKGHRGLLFCAHAVSHYEVFIIQALSGNMTVCFTFIAWFQVTYKGDHAALLHVPTHFHPQYPTIL